MKKFNLMQILPSLNSGGVERGTIDLANHLASKEIKNFIISNGGGLLSYLNKKYVTHFKEAVNSKNFLKLPFTAKKINYIIKENNINILHIRSRAPAWFLPFLNTKDLITVSTFHNVYGHENFIKKYYNKGLNKSDYIIAISDYVKEEISKIYNINPNKITTINRGIDTDFYDSKCLDEQALINFLKKYHIQDNKKIILYPGRLTEWKGQIQFLNVVEKFKNENIIFYFVGDDKNTNYKKKLLSQINKKKLRNQCVILGNLNQKDLRLMYYFSQLVISMPLKPEGFGRTISESLSMKKIILAFNYGGTKNQLEKLDDIYKINSKNEEELYQRIKYIINSPFEIFNDIKNQSRHHVINNFSKKEMLGSYYKFYMSIKN